VTDPDQPHLRPAGPSDLEGILAVQQQSWEASAWPAQIENCLVYRADRQIAGFLLYRRIVDESEILNLAVAPAFRRRGIAKALISYLAEILPGDVLLEVRASNAPALSLYRSAGFLADGRRKAYYHRPVEDAILLRRTATGVEIDRQPC